MPAYSKDIIIEQGIPYWEDFELVQSGSPMDLTDYTGVGTIRADYDSPTYTSFNFSWTDRPNGKVRVHITAEQSANIYATAGVYDMVLLDGAGVPLRLQDGAYTLSRSVSHA